MRKIEFWQSKPFALSLSKGVPFLVEEEGKVLRQAQHERTLFQEGRNA
jgi:hypothetical protein